MEIKCTNCNRKFELDKRSQGQYDFHLKMGCSNWDTSCHICNEKIRVSLKDPVEVFNLRCPIPSCSGWVDFIDDESFWGCGECGSRWHIRERLNADIDFIIAKYPYRGNSYLKGKDNNWIGERSDCTTGRSY